MKEIKLKGLDQSVFYEELSNGLKVILLPFKNKTNYYINYKALKAQMQERKKLSCIFNSLFTILL